MPLHHLQHPWFATGFRPTDEDHHRHHLSLLLSRWPDVNQDSSSIFRRHSSGCFECSRRPHCHHRGLSSPLRVVSLPLQRQSCHHDHLLPPLYQCHRPLASVDGDVVSFVVITNYSLSFSSTNHFDHHHRHHHQHHHQHSHSYPVLPLMLFLLLSFLLSFLFYCPILHVPPHRHLYRDDDYYLQHPFAMILLKKNDDAYHNHHHCSHCY
mmetsp:Transcript_11468/g.22519  ORF Transcript_11468/g.22519 Transcript_11468/m.22519 type:complete len:209 (-) Transcript_11468:646-1272(-)